VTLFLFFGQIGRQRQYSAKSADLPRLFTGATGRVENRGSPYPDGIPCALIEVSPGGPRFTGAVDQ
jgi:hypothetical protein